jgi:hypothetical protein
MGLRPPKVMKIAGRPQSLHQQSNLREALPYTLSSNRSAAKWRDLLFAYSATALNRNANLPFSLRLLFFPDGQHEANKSRRDGRK